MSARSSNLGRKFVWPNESRNDSGLPDFTELVETEFPAPAGYDWECERVAISQYVRRYRLTLRQEGAPIEQVPEFEVIFDPSMGVSVVYEPGGARIQNVIVSRREYFDPQFNEVQIQVNP